VVLVYDVTDKQSLWNLLESKNSWLSELEKKGKSNVAKVIVGARADLSDEKEVTIDDAAAVIDKYNIDIYETSAKTGEGVDQVWKKQS